jgi:hypothetical protein
MDFHLITRNERIALECICNELAMDNRDWSRDDNIFELHGGWVRGCIQIGMPKQTISSAVSSLSRKRIILSNRTHAHLTGAGRTWLQEHHNSLSI